MFGNTGLLRLTDVLSGQIDTVDRAPSEARWRHPSSKLNFPLSSDYLSNLITPVIVILKVKYYRIKIFI